MNLTQPRSGCTSRSNVSFFINLSGFVIGPLSYIGGKNRLAPRIVALLPQHTTYVEAFAGGAQVFFRKPPSPVEVLNDLDVDIVNFLRVCQAHPEELIRCLRYQVASRKWFDLLAAIDPAGLTDIQRAARFFYLQKNAFGGLVLKRNYHYGVVQRPNYIPERIPAAIERAHQRLQHAQLECLPYEEVLKRYDRPSTLFYLDPPYWQRRLYKHNFSEDEFRALQARLQGIKGRFILSLDDRPEVRKLFAAFQLTPLDVTYTAQKQAGRKYRELLITNFQPKEKAQADGSGSPVTDSVTTARGTGRRVHDATPNT